MRNNLEELILQNLQEGMSNAITADILCNKLAIDDKNTFQKAIQTLRRNGKPICANKDGYFIASNKEEIGTYREHLQSIVKSYSVTLHGIKKAEQAFSNTEEV